VKVAARIVIVGVLLACAAGVVWMFAGSAAGDRVVGNANVAGGVAGVLALVVAVGGAVAAGRATAGWRGVRRVRTADARTAAYVAAVVT
jgi:hypothetical protein